MRSTWAFDLAGRLAGRIAAATGTRARVRRRPEGGGYRVEAVLPEGLGDVPHLLLLSVLAEADRYGHRYCGEVDLVWAEVDDRAGRGAADGSG
ncbi:hypothetical protein AB0D08_38800 [Kitasatospora sp. NPDC048540]|uniref:hypothetical protein n=1 Tax=unclassified Kitasatospora TaxID=2633591 RepID=UPI00068CF66E|nr:hypothetical protein [Kitasatospora sp. MBT63]